MSRLMDTHAPSTQRVVGNSVNVVGVGLVDGIARTSAELANHFFFSFGHDGTIAT